MLMFFVRASIVCFAGVATYFFVFWVPCALLSSLPAVQWLAPLIALACAIGAGHFAWSRTKSLPEGVATWAGLGALIVGGIGFVGGFFGPMIFTPEANQGPLLGLLITGPLGALLGAIAGIAFWTRRSRGGLRD